MYCLYRGGLLADSEVIGFPFFVQFFWKIDKRKPVGDQLSIGVRHVLHLARRAE